MNPSDYTCIYSTLTFIADQCRKFNIKTPSVTFDQPLWLKATEIVVDNSMDIVVHLGGFHTLMSFVGSIGSLMDASGLSDVLQIIYGENTVKHMVSGKAIARAIRGHILVETALHLRLQKMILEESTNAEAPSMSEAEILELKSSLGSLGNISELPVVKKFVDCIDALKVELASKSRTAKLWLQYMEYVEIMRQYIRAARTGDWHLSLSTLQKMLNLFAATGHINYAKSARLYLQLMLELPLSHPWLYENISTKGFHFIRRSDKFWSGLWPDIIIEQVLMRSVKSRGGLTRGRGMSESVCMLWIRSMHYCGSLHQSLSTLTDHTHSTSDQHAELGHSRMKRDHDDLQKVSDWFEERNPFDANREVLQSLSSGLTADEIINCDNSEGIGREIHQKLNDLQFSKCSIKRSDQVSTFGKMKNGFRDFF